MNPIEPPISESRLHANRSKATGPTTPAGKKRSSMNALKHGLTARTIVLPNDDLPTYLKFSKELIDSLRPETPDEKIIAQSIADAHWRLSRVKSVEDALFAAGLDEEAGNIETENEHIHAVMTAARTFRDHSGAFTNLTLYEQRIRRGLREDRKELERLQEKRRTERQQTMDEAIRQHKAHEMKAIRWEPAEDGFVFSRPEIAAESRRRERREDAWQAHIAGYNVEEYEARVARSAA